MEQQEDEGVSVEWSGLCSERSSDGRRVEAAKVEVEVVLPCSEEVRSTAGRRRVLEQEEEEEASEALDACATEGEVAAALCREAGLLSTARGREEVEEHMEEKEGCRGAKDPAAMTLASVYGSASLPLRECGDGEHGDVEETEEEEAGGAPEG